MTIQNAICPGSGGTIVPSDDDEHWHCGVCNKVVEVRVEASHQVAKYHVVPSEIQVRYLAYLEGVQKDGIRALAFPSWFKLYKVMVDV